MGVTRKLAAVLGPQRRRLAALVLVVGVLVVGAQLFEAYPRDTEVRYRMGPSHAQVSSLSVLYLREGEPVAGASFDWPDGAPGSVVHTVTLGPGRYEIEAALRGGGADRALRRALQVPAQGPVRIDLFDEALARVAQPTWPVPGAER